MFLTCFIQDPSLQIPYSSLAAIYSYNIVAKMDRISAFNLVLNTKGI